MDLSFRKSLLTQLKTTFLHFPENIRRLFECLLAHVFEDLDRFRFPEVVDEIVSTFLLKDKGILTQAIVALTLTFFFFTNLI